MDLKTWIGWYEKIIEDFKFDPVADMEAAEYLNDFLQKHRNIKVDMDDLPHNDKFIVFGAGPSIKKHLKLLKEDFDLGVFTVIAADGATTALLEESILPDIIVTDLDGKINDIIRANKAGSFVVVHAHGNNLERLKSYLPKLRNIFGTTQTSPIGDLHNFGGFTDGDRAVFLAVELGAKLIILAGMDFGDIITKYSRPQISEKTEKADKIKRLKLEYAKKLINWIMENEDVKIYNLVEVKSLKD
ncbi:MAG: DUF115 domain-containing protein [Methanothermobacter sp.]|nr:DUF115 domain-containing protein [Methanothermobacter sp.]